MRKFSVRWWVSPNLTQWRYMAACGSRWHFVGWGCLTVAQMDELSLLR